MQAHAQTQRRSFLGPARMRDGRGAGGRIGCRVAKPREKCVRQLQDTDTMGAAGIAPLPRCAVKRSRAAPKRDAYLQCTTQSGQEGAPVCGSRPRPRLFFFASTSRTREVGHDAPRSAAGGPVVHGSAACCPCWFTGTLSNRERCAPAQPMLRATRRTRTRLRGST